MLLDTEPGALDPAPPAPPALFAARRDRFLERIGGGVAILAAAPELIKSRDTEIPYRQASDLYYLTGFPEPETVAVLTPLDPDHRLTLFVRPRDPERETWVGARVGVERAGEAYGADAVYPIEELGSRLPDLLRPADRIFYHIGAHPRIDAIVTDVIGRARRARQRSGVGPTAAVDLEAVTGEMRLLKDEHEVERIRKAATITAAAHEAAVRSCRPGVGEWQVQAALEARMRWLGADGPAFPSIVGSGANATTLHYVENRRRIEEDDLVLVDAGAEWGMYCADITRTFPASGRFSGPQRDLYDVVLAAERAAIAAGRPGAPVTAIHDAAVGVLTRGMLDLGLLTGQTFQEALEKQSYKRFYMHQTSHWLGLDVHDTGLYGAGPEPLALAPGMVYTVEPGIYVPAATDDVPEAFRGLGIRIEDDILIVEGGHENLTRAVPVDPDELAALVGSDATTTLPS